MGKIKQGILGGFSGKVGPVIGTSWKGKAIIKARPLSHNDRNSVAQQEQRAKFSLVSKFLACVNGFIAFGFAKKAVGITAPNAAMAANLESAVTGDFPNYSLAMNKVLVSDGKIDLPYNPGGTVDSGTLTFTWADNTGRGDALADDQVMVLVYNPTVEQSVYTTALAARSTRTADLVCPTAWSGNQVHVYFAMRREKTGDTSVSTYIGDFTL
ncbi:MAG: DUF6266 family protein [Bacteroidales bacterium]|nr:DUF6266 family protein [Bacteroidales bacterium]